LMPVAKGASRQRGPRPLPANVLPSALKEIAGAKVEIARIKAREAIMLAKLPVYALGRKIGELLKENREENFVDGSGFFSDDEDTVRLDFPREIDFRSPLVRAVCPSFANLVKAFTGFRLK
jgi:hypothetical protein